MAFTWTISAVSIKTDMVVSLHKQDWTFLVEFLGVDDYFRLKAQKGNEIMSEPVQCLWQWYSKKKKKKKEEKNTVSEKRWVTICINADFASCSNEQSAVTFWKMVECTPNVNGLVNQFADHSADCRCWQLSHNSVEYRSKWNHSVNPFLRK